jgi:hypothetical protein
MKRSTNTALFSLSLAAVVLAACHNSSSGGGGATLAVVDEVEPNGTTGQANLVAFGGTAHGAVADNTDTDFWRIALTANQLVSLEVYGNRFDYAGWTASGNAPSVRLFDTDGTTLLMTQNDEILSWNDDQDTDVLTFRVPATGTYYVAVDVADPFSAGGEYLLSVKTTTLPAPLQFELEPAAMTGGNDTDATAEAIAPGSVFGFHVDDEADWYAFDVTVPSLMTFTLHAHRNGVWQSDDDYFDSFVTLRDSALTSLDANDDTFYLDSSLNYVLNVPGTYYFEVEECCGTGDTGYYFEFGLQDLSTLSPVMEVEPNDDTLTAQSVAFGAFVQGTVDVGNDDLFAFDCNAGDRINVQVFDVNNLQGAAQTVTVTIEDPSAMNVATDFGFNLRTHRTILTETGTFFVRVSSGAATDYALLVTQETAGFEVEPNDDIASAGAFDADGRAAGMIDVMDDPDLFAFTATAGTPVRFECLADDSGPNGFFELDGFGSTMQPELNVYDSTGAMLTNAGSSFGTAVGIKDGLATVGLMFVPPANGTYYVEVLDETSSFGAGTYYVLRKF